MKRYARLIGFLAVAPFVFLAVYSAENSALLWVGANPFVADLFATLVGIVIAGGLTMKVLFMHMDSAQ